MTTWSIFEILRAFNQEQPTKMKTDKEKLTELLQLTATLIDHLEDFGSESCEDYRAMVDEIIAEQ